MVHVAYLMLLFPLAGFAVLVAAGRRMGDPLAGWVATVAVGGAFVVSCIVFAGLLGLPSDHILFCGIALGLADADAAINRWRAPRAPVDEFATFRGFPESDMPQS